MNGYTRIENRLIDWLLEQDISARQMKLVLFVLRYTVCFHREFAELSLSYIEKATGILRRNAQTDIKMLVEKKILRERFDGQKRYLSLGTVLEIENSKKETVLNSENTSVLDFENRTVLNSENKEIKSIKTKEINNNDQTAFDQFWTLYPRKVSKPQAKRAFQTALKKTSFETLMLGLEGYKNYLTKEQTDTKYIKHPATWLNAEAWNDIKPEQVESKQLRLVQSLSDKEQDHEELRKLYERKRIAIAGSCS